MPLGIALKWRMNADLISAFVVLRECLIAYLIAIAIEMLLGGIKQFLLQLK